MQIVILERVHRFDPYGKRVVLLLFLKKKFFLTCRLCHAIASVATEAFRVDLGQCIHVAESMCRPDFITMIPSRSS